MHVTKFFWNKTEFKKYNIKKRGKNHGGRGDWSAKKKKKEARTTDFLFSFYC